MLWPLILPRRNPRSGGEAHRVQPRGSQQNLAPRDSGEVKEGARSVHCPNHLFRVPLRLPETRASKHAGSYPGRIG